MRLIILIALIFFHGFSSWADTNKLRWGADIESGAPFSFKDPEDPNNIVGFEAELVHALAKKMGREVEFVQNSWDGLIEGLQRNDYDIVANGIEITQERSKQVNFSQPYYLTYETLAVKAENKKIHRLEDCENLRVGTLGASLAERILRGQKFPMTILTYSEEVHLYSDLSNGRLDAVLLDEPIALYYAKPKSELKLVGPPIGEMLYGIATRKTDSKMSVEIDQALGELIKSGEMQTILERWNLWNPITAKTWGMDSRVKSSPTAYNKFIERMKQDQTGHNRWKKYWSYLPLLVKGAVMTLEISILAMILAVGLGLILALMRLYGGSILSSIALLYVEIFRGTPLLIQLFLIFYGLPHLGIRLEPFIAAVLGLGLNYAACEAENYRSGVLSIPKAQMDAAYALGMNWRQSLRHVILPQSMRVVLPPVTNDFIALLKDSSLVSVISMVELTTIYGQLASSSFDYLGLGLLTALIYFLIGLPFVRFSRKMEDRMNKSRLTVQS